MNSLAKLIVRRSSRALTALGLPIFIALSLAAGCGGDNAQPICTASSTAQAATDFCAPTSIASGQTLRLQIREQCGGCTQRATRCEVAVQGQEVKLRLLGETCILPPNSACPAICAISTFDCMVPPLAAGTYRVTTEAGSPTVVMMTASTTVSATSCTVQ